MVTQQNTYLKEYKKTQVETANPEQLLILLYDAAIQFLNKAKVNIDESDDEQYQKNLFACQKIIIEFMNTLDMEKGGEVAENLYRLYQYLYKTLITTGISQDKTLIDEVLKHLKSLRETWQKAIQIAQAERDAKRNEDATNNIIVSQEPSTPSHVYTADENDGYEYVDDDEDYDEEEDDE